MKQPEPVTTPMLPAVTIDNEDDDDLELDLASTVSMVLRVLIVDDAESQRLVLLKQVENLGFETATAADGAQALALIDTFRPHIILSDWLMPHMDGIALCRAARQGARGRLLYFILLTAYGDDERLLDAFDAGADDFLTKPINLRKLQARLRAAKRIINLQTELRRKIEALRELNAALTETNKRLFDVAHHDTLTGLPNRRLIIDRLQQEWAAYQRRKTSFAVALLDLDYFKRVNDERGHDVGDAVLARLARVLRRQIRAEDIVARFGGEEFLILMPNTELGAARRLAERVRASVAREPFFGSDATPSMTASIGVAAAAPDLDSWQALLKVADTQLYAAKGAGRDRVCG